MQWSDEAIILSTRKFNERDLIVNIFAQNEGIYSGLVRAGQSNSKFGIFQPGNIVEATWRARLDEQLGNLSAEVTNPISAKLLTDRLKLQALLSVTTLMRTCLMERDPHQELYSHCKFLLEHMSLHNDWLAEYVRFEIELLRHCGFGLDLSSCAATGEVENLSYVSPKSGRAVSSFGASGFESKLLNLPEFLLGSAAHTHDCIIKGLELTEYFFKKHIFYPQNRQLPQERIIFAEAFSKKFELQQSA